MKREIGLVSDCDKYSGKIITQKEEYIFLDTDIQEDISYGDIVEFEGENKQKIKRAYFVKKLKKDFRN